MKIVIDECLPKKLTQIFNDHDVWTVPQIGLAGFNDSDLLNELNKRDIDIFITIDGNIEYQQKFIDREFGTIVIQSVTNRLGDLLHLKSKIIDAITKIKSGIVLHVS